MAANTNARQCPECRSIFPDLDSDDDINPVLICTCSGDDTPTRPIRIIIIEGAINDG